MAWNNLRPSIRVQLNKRSINAQAIEKILEHAVETNPENWHYSAPKPYYIGGYSYENSTRITTIARTDLPYMLEIILPGGEKIDDRHLNSIRQIIAGDIISQTDLIV